MQLGRSGWRILVASVAFLALIPAFNACRRRKPADVNAIVVPTTPIDAPLLNQETSRIGAIDYPTRALLLRLNRPANLAGTPSLTVPCGFTRAGLPIGLQIMGGVSSETILLRIANAFERARPQTRRPPL